MTGRLGSAVKGWIACLEVAACFQLDVLFRGFCPYCCCLYVTVLSLALHVMYKEVIAYLTSAAPPRITL